MHLRYLHPLVYIGLLILAVLSTILFAASLEIPHEYSTFLVWYLFSALAFQVIGALLVAARNDWGTTVGGIGMLLFLPIGFIYWDGLKLSTNNWKYEGYEQVKELPPTIEIRFNFVRSIGIYCGITIIGGFLWSKGWNTIGLLLFAIGLLSLIRAYRRAGRSVLALGRDALYFTPSNPAGRYIKIPYSWIQGCQYFLCEAYLDIEVQGKRRKLTIQLFELESQEVYPAAMAALREKLEAKGIPEIPGPFTQKAA